jgi:dienelactone hydrolase
VVGVIVVLCLALAGVGAWFLLANRVPGFKTSVSVGAPTRLDWVFAESHKSEPEKPQYKVFPSTTVQYEFFAPPNYDSQKAYPLILFLSADPQAPAGWTTFKKLCMEKGVLFAAPRAVGDNHPTWERIRIVADVLDDVRKNYHVDTDRTYIGGIGSGARMACRVGFALPELFGGVMAFDGADFPPNDVFGQQRITERLSITLAAPDSSPTKVKLDQLYAAYFKEVKTRVNFLTYPGQVGELPSPALAEEIFAWMDEAAPERRKLAEKYPSTRISGDTDPPPTRELYGDAFVKDAIKRMTDEPNTKVGIAMLDAAVNRWSATPAAGQATEAIKAYVASGGKSVTTDVENEKRPYDLALARAIETYLRGLDPATLEKTWDKDPLEEKSAKELRDQAVFVWNLVKKTKSSPPDLVKEADQRLPVLEKLGPKKS